MKAQGQGGAAAGRAGGSRPPKSCGGAARTCIVRGSVDRSWSAGHDAGLGAAQPRVGCLRERPDWLRGSAV